LSINKKTETHSINAKMTTLQGGTIKGLQTQALFYLQKQFGKYIIEKFIKLFVVISTSVKYYGGQFFTSNLK